MISETIFIRQFVGSMTKIPHLSTGHNPATHQFLGLRPKSKPLSCHFHPKIDPLIVIESVVRFWPNPPPEKKKINA